MTSLISGTLVPEKVTKQMQKVSSESTCVGSGDGVADSDMKQRPRSSSGQEKQGKQTKRKRQSSGTSENPSGMRKLIRLTNKPKGAPSEVPLTCIHTRKKQELFRD